MHESRKRTTPLLLKYLKVFEKNPKSLVFAPLAEIYRKLGMISEALKVLKQGIKYNPDYMLGYLSLAECYFDLGKYEISYETISPFAQNNLDNITLQRLLARVCEKLGKSEESLQAYKCALFLSPRDRFIQEKVKFLENQIDSLNSINHRSINTVYEQNTLQNQYPESDPDQWGRVFDQKDIIPIPSKFNRDEKKQINEIEGMEGDNEWSKRDLLKAITVDENENADKKQKVVEQEAIVAQPTITHTLVDLYANNKLYDKAICVLEKLLELNPNDKNIRDKLNNFKSLYSEYSDQKMTIDLSIVNIRYKAFLAKINLRKKELYSFNQYK
ncbi:MAG: tetratricopeptide repeat protein [Oligoflexia bacterium]|nr:tetratricopeptide repeat protein [Oligoflexia bacterium]